MKKKPGVKASLIEARKAIIKKKTRVVQRQ